MKFRLLPILLLSLLWSISFSQNYSGGTGTQSDPYQIATLNDLRYLSEHATDWAKHFKQTADIDATSTNTWNVGNHDNNISTPNVAMGFSPIGNGSFKFSGTYDGNNNSILGLYINRPTNDNIGLFGYLTGSLSNIEMFGGSVIGGNYVGNLLGYAFNGNITNSSATGNIRGFRSIGGLIGSMENAILSSSSAGGKVEGYSRQLGGIVGFSLYSSISNSFANGNVDFLYVDEWSAYVGGLIGEAYECSISHCYSTGSISGECSAVGGLVGDFYSSSSTISLSDSYASGQVSGQYQVGGLIGSLRGLATNVNATGDITYFTNPNNILEGDVIGGLVGVLHQGSFITFSFASGNITGLGNDIGGFVGRCGGEINSCYCIGNVVGISSIGGFSGRNMGGSINTSFASGDVSGEYFVGAFVGDILMGSVRNCYANGNVNGDEYTGGLVGYSDRGTIINSYAKGNVTGGISTGGLFGSIEELEPTIITNSFYDNQTTGQNDNDGRGVPKNTMQMQNQATFTDAGWDFVGESTNGTTNYWKGMSCDDGYPVLAWEDKVVGPTITMTTAGSNYGTGAVNLTANSSAGFVNWYSSSTGGSILATGTSFTTPVLSSTTTFYAEASLSGCLSANRVPVQAIINNSIQLNGSSCGKTLVNMNDALYSDVIPGATSYKFEIRKQVDNSLVAVSNTSSNLFRLSWLSYNPAQYNTSYKIRVSALVGGIWQPYGSSCTVISPYRTKLASGSCGINVTNLSTALYCEPVVGATDYKFEVRRTSDNSLLGAGVRGSSSTLYRLSWLVFNPAQLNSSYKIRVSALVGGVWYPYGESCTVTTNTSGMIISEELEDYRESLGFEELLLETYPNPNDGNFTIISSHEGIFSIINELGQLIQKVEITKENNYQTKVENLRQGVYFVTGTINNEIITKKVIVQ